MSNRWESLAGIIGDPRKGLKILGVQRTAAVYLNNTLLSDNPLRKWAIITNNGAADATVYFWPYEGDAGTAHILRPGGSLIINEDLPWSGSILFGASLNTELDAMEASIVT